MATLFYKSFMDHCKDPTTKTMEISKFKTLVHDTYVATEAQFQEKEAALQEEKKQQAAVASSSSSWATRIFG